MMPARLSSYRINPESVAAPIDAKAVFLQARFIELMHHLISPWAYSPEQHRARDQRISQLKWMIT